MADTSIIDRTGKGSALSATNYDANISSACGIVEAETGTTHTIDHEDQNKTIEYSNASSIAVTLTAAATIQAAIDTDHFKVTLKNIGAGTVTVTRSGSDTIDGATTLVLEQYESATIQTDSAGTVWNIIARDQNLLNTRGAGGVVALYSAGNTDTEERRIKLTHLDGTLRGYVGWVSSTSLILGNKIAEGLIYLIGRKTGDSADSNLLFGDPDGRVALFYNGTEVARTATAATGGLVANNTSTGAGFERVLTTSDQGAGNAVAIGNLTSGAYPSGSTEDQLEIDAVPYESGLDADTSTNRITNSTGRNLVVKVVVSFAATSSAGVEYNFYIKEDTTQVGEQHYVRMTTAASQVHFERIFTLNSGSYVAAFFDPDGPAALTILPGGTFSVTAI